MSPILTVSRFSYKYIFVFTYVLSHFLLHSFTLFHIFTYFLSQFYLHSYFRFLSHFHSSQNCHIPAIPQSWSARIKFLPMPKTISLALYLPDQGQMPSRWSRSRSGPPSELPGLLHTSPISPIFPDLSFYLITSFLRFWLTIPLLYYYAFRLLW